MSFWEPYKDGYVIKIKLSPNAKKNAFGTGVYVDAGGNEYLKASVVCVPEKGKANKELLKMISKNLKIAVSEMEIISGQTEHLKKSYIATLLSSEQKQKMDLKKKKKNDECANN